MKNSFRLFLKLAALGILLIIVGFMIWISPPRFILEMGLPAIAKNLPSNIQQADSEFMRRAQEKYPDGTDSAVLLEQLQKDGFTVWDRNFTPVGEEYLYISKGKFPCSYTWQITWKKTSDLKVSNLKGGYTMNCV